jgi:hypothetical protein
MAYTYTKLTDVELVQSAVEPNLLVEEGGEIKRISASNVATPQVKADWNEEDANSAAFILNKPDLSQVGGGVNVITYTIASGALQLDGIAATAQEVVDEWNNGSLLRIGDATNCGSVVSVSYTVASGAVSDATLSYYSNATIESISI